LGGVLKHSETTDRRQGRWIRLSTINVHIPQKKIFFETFIDPHRDLNQDHNLTVVELKVKISPFQQFFKIKTRLQILRYC